MAEPPTKVMKLDSGSSIPNEYINPKKIIEMLAGEYSGSYSAARESLINSNSTERQLLKKFVAEMRELEQFFVSLCADVLSDVLSFGTRHWLAKLERIGRRFHRIVGNFFYKAPIIQLNLELTGTKSNVLIAYINGKLTTKAAIFELAKSPQFVRFNKVNLCYKSEGTIKEKCKKFVNYLHGIEAITLNGVNQIYFAFPISKKFPSSFSNHLQVLNYLRKELLPVCGTSRSYKFELSFNCDYDDYPRDDVDTNVIAQILQMHPIDRCSNIELRLFGIRPPMQWPIETISDWLHQKSDGIAEKSQKRFLKIYSAGWENQNERSENFRNEQDLCDHLRETFNKAEIPSMPFHFEFRTSSTSFNEIEIKEQTLSNKKTNEAFWIAKPKYDYTCIKRFIVKKDEVGANSQKT